MTTSADPRTLVLVDTNVLLAATDTSRAMHEAATWFLENDERRLAVTPQVAREYLAVATRPVASNGLGLASADAVANLRQLQEEMELLPDDLASVRVLLDLAERGVASGKQVHDANVVAVALAHGAEVVVTDNTRHFSRYEDLVRIEELSALPS